MQGDMDLTRDEVKDHWLDAKLPEKAEDLDKEGWEERTAIDDDDAAQACEMNSAKARQLETDQCIVNSTAPYEFNIQHTVRTYIDRAAATYHAQTNHRTPNRTNPAVGGSSRYHYTCWPDLTSEEDEVDDDDDDGWRSHAKGHTLVIANEDLGVGGSTQVAGTERSHYRPEE